MKCETKNRISSKFYFLGFIIVALTVFPNVTNAASLYFSPSSGSYNIGSNFSVDIFISSPDQEMNAVEGIVSFPQDKLEITSLSKADSIITFWAQEPGFSNTAGRVNFEGVVLPDGFKGQTGKVITLNFRAKVVGTVSLNFSEISILAHDGRGTNILTGGMERASFSLKTTTVTEPSVQEEIPRETGGFLGAPGIYSPTHPDSEKWYSNPNPKFEWSVSSGIIGVRLLVGRNANQNPTVDYTPPISEKQLENLADGVWYFSAQFRDSSQWGLIGRFKFQIDTQPPKPFKIEIKEGKETTNPQPTLFFETTDETSGIDHYEIIIDGKEQIKTDKGEYKIPSQDLGKHSIIVKAVDKAGNANLAMTEIEILPIESPVITDYLEELTPGGILSIKGTAIPEKTIKVYLQKNEEEIKEGETKSDKKGKWAFGVGPVEKGVYQVWTEAICSSGEKSRPSEKVNILVSPPVFIRIGRLVIDYLTTVITLLTLILAIIFGVFWAWLKIKKRNKKIKKEISEADKALHKSFEDLKMETEKQVAKLDGKSGLSRREKKICNDLKKALKRSEKSIAKEIKGIGKEIKK